MISTEARTIMINGETLEVVDAWVCACSGEHGMASWDEIPARCCVKGGYLSAHLEDNQGRLVAAWDEDADDWRFLARRLDGPWGRFER